jgi:hypothetical protein
MAVKTAKELEAELAQLRKENEQLKKEVETEKALSCKVSAKGCVSVYGLNARWPVSLYARQWQRLKEFMPTIEKFIEKNKDSLSFKKNSEQNGDDKE